MTVPAAIPGPQQLPSVGWLLIHGQPGGIGTVDLMRSVPDDEPDEEGRTSSTPTAVPTRGYAALLSQDEVQWAGTMGVEAQAVVAVSRDVDVDETDEVRLGGIGQALDGLWRVTAVRTTPVHVRLLLDRMVDVGG